MDGGVRQHQRVCKQWLVGKTMLSIVTQAARVSSRSAVVTMKIFGIATFSYCGVLSSVKRSELRFPLV